MISRFGKFKIEAFLLLFLTNYVLSETVIRTPARLLAKRTGAAQFEEHIDKPIYRDCNEHSHRLRKRSSDEDLDYEVYQGVVGRPGIDFPIFPRIPQTTFSCRSYGNGYFADLETTCQVFHICEEGRKISFLCPNGTIFQQSELTCDWWFKVNCAGSPGFYAESSEILNKARRHRLKANSLHKGFKTNNKAAEHYKASERRIDSNENPSLENFDFEDLSDDRSNDKFVDRSSDSSNDRIGDRRDDNSNERSNYRSKDGLNNKSSDRSSVRSHDRSNIKSNGRPNARPNNRLNNRSNDKLKIAQDELLANPTHHEDNHNQHNDHELQIAAESSSFVKNPRINSYTSADKTLNKETEFDSDKPLEKVKDIQVQKNANPSRGSQKHTFNDDNTADRIINNEKPTGFYITSRPDISSASTTGNVSYYTTALPEHYTNRNSLDDIDKQFVAPESEDPPTFEEHSTIRPDFFVNGPIISRVTTSSQYPGTYSTARRLDSTRTTPFYTPTVPSIARNRPTESKSFFLKVVRSDEPSTLIGVVTPKYTTPMPLNAADKKDNSEIHRFSIFSNGDLNVQSSMYPETPSKLSEHSLRSSTSGPTYLPKTIKGKKDNLVTPPSIDNLVSRNVEGILQTVGMLTETMKNNIDDKNSSSRVGLEIPPSSGPGTLISLTNYFANDNQIVSTTNSYEEKSTTVTPFFDISVGLLSNKTSGKYLSLFGISQDNSTIDNYSSESTVAPKVVNAPTVVGEFTRTTIRDLVQDPETRKIAQVFSNAISKYIENPETFRKDLIDVRPQPPSRNLNLRLDSTTRSSISDKRSTVTDVNVAVNTLSNNVSETTSKPYLPVTTENVDTTTSSTTESNDIAKEINSQFDVSTESTETTSLPKTNIEFGISSDLLPPSQDEENEHESLHKVQSQSFVKSYNDLTKGPKVLFDSDEKKDQNEKDQTENPWAPSAITQTEATANKTQSTTIQNQPCDTAETTESQLGKSYNSEKPEIPTDKSQAKKSSNKGSANAFSGIVTTNKTPLTIAKPTKTNQWAYSAVTPIKNKLEDKTVTAKPNLWLQNQLPTVKPTENPWSQITQSIYLDPLTINDGLMRELQTTTSSPFAFVNTDRSRFEDVSQGEEDIDDILNSPELSSELLPKNSGLQRIANKLFGGLNETEAVHLQNVMKKAEHNQNVLRLLLLLIQTCDDQNGKALEKSRKILLSALIGMDDKLKIKSIYKAPVTTTNKIPVTTYHRVFNDKPTTPTTTKSPTTTELSNSSEETTRFEIRVPEPEDDDDITISTSTTKPVSSDRQSKSYNNPNRTSDERALELLKSLYSLASKFSRR